MSSHYAAIAEYETPAALLHAAEKITGAGYSQVDSHTPFPVHGMDDALKQAPSPVGWICIVGGILGILGSQWMMYWMNAVDYPFWVSGKLPYAWPTTIPITFECMVLLAAFGAFFGMLALNKLPHHYNPVFKHSTFWRASDDRFFLAVAATDPKFDQQKTVELLRDIGGQNVELVED